MLPLLASVPFGEPARAQANLALLESRLPGGLLQLLPIVLAQVPDPDVALNDLERFTRNCSPGVLGEMTRQPVLLHYLLTLFSHSRFLSETLIQQPSLLTWLGRDRQLARVKSKDDLLEEYARFEATTFEADAAVVLARFKRREYLRIALKDILGIAGLAETTLELSTLADVLLEKALEIAAKELRSRYGSPQARDSGGRVIAARFAVVSLGKLGGYELNYSSDIDLLFLYAGKGETSGPRRIPNQEYFVRLAQHLIQLIAGVTPEGPVFRVDLRLRPGGGEGDLAISLPAAVEYYRRSAREWELQMLLKARHSASDVGLVREFLEALESRIYRHEMHFAAVESVLATREQLDRKLTRQTPASATLNVKLSPGGIRDIEFLVQCLQRLYGQRDPWVRSGGTLVALQKLHDKGYLPSRDYFQLASAYQFLRKVEHRLQLERGQQTHTLPQSGQALALLARRCGIDALGREAVESLRKQLDEHTGAVRAIYTRNLPRPPTAVEEEPFVLETLASAVVPAYELSYASLLTWLQQRRSPLYTELQRIQIPERARKTLHRFLSAAMASWEQFEGVNAAAVALPAALEIFTLSEPLAELLVRKPERLRWFHELCGEATASPAEQLVMKLPVQRSEVAMDAMLVELVGQPGSLGERMGWLRQYFHEAVFRWGVRAVCRRRPVWDNLAEFSQLGECMIRTALSMAEEPARASCSGRFAVLALGRMGTQEMDLGSDADLVFLVDTPASRREYTLWRRVAEKLIHIVSGYTREGTLFPVDVRLRAGGSQGELVQNADSVLEYFQERAEVWEAITYLKVRPIAGDLEFAQAWCESLRRVLAARFADWERIRAQLKEMRVRLEEENKKTPGQELNFKTGWGGIYDIDFVLSAFYLQAGAQMMAGRNLQTQVEDLPALCSLGAEAGQLLARAALFLRALDHSVRLATGRAASTLPPPARSKPVAELLERFLGQPVGTAELRWLLEQIRQQVRRVYEEVFV